MASLFSSALQLTYLLFGAVQWILHLRCIIVLSLRVVVETANCNVHHHGLICDIVCTRTMKLAVCSYGKTLVRTQCDSKKTKWNKRQVHFSDCAFLFSERAGKKRRLADEWRCSPQSHEVASLYFETVHLRVDDFPPTPTVAD
jgi:hypothetical protein